MHSRLGLTSHNRILGARRGGGPAASPASSDFPSTSTSSSLAGSTLSHLQSSSTDRSTSFVAFGRKPNKGQQPSSSKGTPSSPGAKPFSSSPSSSPPPASSPAPSAPTSTSVTVEDVSEEPVYSDMDEDLEDELEEEEEEMETAVEGLRVSSSPRASSRSSKLQPGENPLGFLDQVQEGDPPCLIYLTGFIKRRNREGMSSEEVLRLYEMDIRSPAMTNPVIIARFIRGLAAAVEPLSRPDKAAYHGLYLRAAETLLSVKLKPKYQFLVSLPLIASNAMNLPWNLDEVLQRKTEAAVLKWGWLHGTVAVNILFHYGKLSQPIPHDLLSVIMAAVEYSVKREDRRMRVGVMLKVLTSLCRISAVPEATRALVLFEPFLEAAYRTGKLIANSEPRITLAYRVVNRSEPVWLSEFRRIRKALFRGSIDSESEGLKLRRFSAAAPAPSQASTPPTAALEEVEGGTADSDGEWMTELAESFRAFEEEEAEFDSLLHDIQADGSASPPSTSYSSDPPQGTPDRRSSNGAASSSSPGTDFASRVVGSEEAQRKQRAQRSLEEARYRSESIGKIKHAPTGQDLLKVYRKLRAERTGRPKDTYSQRTDLQILGYFIQRAGEFAWRLQQTKKPYRPLPLVSSEYLAASANQKTNGTGSSPGNGSGGSNGGGNGREGRGVSSAPKEVGVKTIRISELLASQRGAEAGGAASSSSSSSSSQQQQRNGGTGGARSGNNSSAGSRSPSPTPTPSTPDENRQLLRDLQVAFMEASTELLARDRDLMKKQSYGVKPWEHSYYMGLSQADLNTLEARYADWLSSQRLLPETAYRTLNACQRLQIRPKGAALISLMQALSLTASRPELLDVHKRGLILYAFSQLAMSEEFNRCCIWFLPSIVEAARETRGFSKQPILHNKLEMAFVNMGLPKPAWLQSSPHASANATSSSPPSNNGAVPSIPGATSASAVLTAIPSTPAVPAPPAPLSPEEKKAQKLAKRAAQAAVTAAGQGVKAKELPPFKLPVPREQLFLDEPLGSPGENSEKIFKAIADDPDRFAEAVKPKLLLKFLYMVSKRGVFQPVPKTVGFGTMKGPFSGTILYSSLSYLTYFEGWRPVIKRHLASGKLDSEDIVTLWRSLKEARFRPDVEIVRWMDQRTHQLLPSMTDEELAYMLWSVANANIALSETFATKAVEQLLLRVNRLAAAHACRAFYSMAIYTECVHMTSQNSTKKGKSWSFSLEQRKEMVALFEAFARRIGALPDWDFALDERTNGQVVSGVRLLRTSLNPRLRRVPELIPPARLEAFTARFRALVLGGRDPQRVSRLQDSGTEAMSRCLELYYKYYMLQVDAMFQAQFGGVISSRDDYPLELTPEQIHVERVTDDGLHSIDLTIENPLKGQKLAIEIDGPLHHTFTLDLNVKRKVLLGLTGKTLARQRLLMASGWKCMMLTGDDLTSITRSLENATKKLQEDPTLEARLIQSASIGFPYDELKERAKDMDPGAVGALIRDTVEAHMNRVDADEIAATAQVEGQDSAMQFAISEGLVPSPEFIRVIRRFLVMMRAISEVLMGGQVFPALVLGELYLGVKILPKETYDKLWQMVFDAMLKTRILADGTKFTKGQQYKFTKYLNVQEVFVCTPEQYSEHMWNEILTKIRAEKIMVYRGGAPVPGLANEAEEDN